MSPADITDTFSECDKNLFKLFRKYIEIPDRHIESYIKLNYLLILDAVVTPSQQCSMYKTLRLKLTGETRAISSNVSQFDFI